MEEILIQVKEGLGSKIKNWEEKNPRRIYISIDREIIKEAASFIFLDCKARFVIATGTDTPLGYEIFYHFSFDPIGTIVSLRVLIPKEDPKIDSIAIIVKGAEYIEREIYDMLGIKFTGHPDPRRLLLSDDWPEDVFPLRKDGKK